MTIITCPVCRADICSMICGGCGAFTPLNDTLTCEVCGRETNVLGCFGCGVEIEVTRASELESTGRGAGVDPAPEYLIPAMELAGVRMHRHADGAGIDWVEVLDTGGGELIARVTGAEYDALVAGGVR